MEIFNAEKVLIDTGLIIENESVRRGGTLFGQSINYNLFSDSWLVKYGFCKKKAYLLDKLPGLEFIQPPFVFGQPTQTYRYNSKPTVAESYLIG